MKIQVEEAGQAPRTLEVDAPCVTFGRDARNLVVLAGEAVSAFHLEVRVGADGLVARDLGSRNGTAVTRGPRTTAAPLPPREYVGVTPQDTLLLGAQDQPVRVRVEATAAAAARSRDGDAGHTISVSRPVAAVSLADLEPTVWPTLVTLNQALLASTDADEIVRVALAALLRLVPAASHARLARFAPGPVGAGEVPAVGSVVELARGAEAPTRVDPESMSRALLDRVLLSRMVRDEVGLVWMDVGRDAPPSASLAALDVRSVAGAPLRVSDRPLGVLQVDARGPGAGTLDRSHLDRLLVVSGPLGLALRNAEQMQRVTSHRDHLATENTRLRAELSLGDERTLLVGDGPAISRVRDLVERVAASDLPVLVTGETGTGKELIARLVHACSTRRRGAAFVATNVATLPAGLVEGELFGAARGAYTGADVDRPGLFEAADGGTLFLDEVGELPRPAQAAMLRVLQEGEVRRVGEVHARRVDVRIVAATNRDLPGMVRAGTFREDLLYRLNTVTVEVPPLRARREDIPLLIEHLLRRSAEKQRRPIPELSGEARRVLMGHHWPGNVRQLDNELARAIALTPAGQTIDAGALSPELRGLSRESDVLASLRAEQTLRDAVDAFSREYVRAALAAHEGNRTHAAQTLGMSRVGLQKLIKRLGLDTDAP